MVKTSMYRIVIVDDENDSIEVLIKLLSSIQTIRTKIVATCTNLEEGITIIKTNRPDIVFLDIEMPGGNGLDIYDYFQKPEFKVIFITAYAQYAIAALKKSASDYLLKPINIIELKESLRKVTDQIESEYQKEVLIDRFPYLHTSSNEGKNVILDVENGFIVQNTNNILYCIASQSYSIIVTSSGKEITVSKSLKEMQLILPSSQFYRTHKSYLVNIQHIHKFIKNNESYVQLISGDKIPVSVRTSISIVKDLKNMLQK